ncbi:Uncharacterized protein dnm_019440 [Desulfonema magnum]|uniref:Uncharacterized protein n=1 Tax=Desulfonema magnum TaxID=45655 RepID=A0A975BI47_9BACT|nr:Uncharacterized protein dnm_019440 [Desulfonema magnum]
MKKPGFSPPVMKIFSDKKPGFSKCIFTVKIPGLPSVRRKFSLCLILKNCPSHCQILTTFKRLIR